MSDEFPPPSPAEAPAPSREQIEADVVARLKTVYDPEIPVDIYELGLVYAVEVSSSSHEPKSFLSAASVSAGRRGDNGAGG